MDLAPLFCCIAALEVHQAKLTFCALREGAADEPLVDSPALTSTSP